MRKICIELKDFEEMEREWHNIKVKDLIYICQANEDNNMVKVGLNLGILTIQGEWVPDKEEQMAAWEMYVELVTRISVAELKEDEGLLREALSSLYTLFGTTRQILRQHGPSVAQPKDKSELSFGYLAVAILNRELRPVLAKWHPLLCDYENAKPEGVSQLEHERKWEQAQELRKILNETRLVLVDYANLLAEAAKVPSLIVER
ncbi:MAG TPA: hypothetical protein VEG44_00285 [Candidatus Acidoferrales bacterium]|nr:hypothetical protein [Candidatus Acidoferrales bacterium]